MHLRFWDELRRRNVIRMAGLYLVGAWLIVQVAGTVLPMFGAPAWLPRSIVILLAIGFLPALAFAWAFELTPDGIKRDADVPPAASIAPQTAQRMNRLILAVLVLAVVYFAVDKFVLAPRRDAGQAVQAAQAAQTAATTAAATPAPEVTVAPGVAVLPFKNMSPDPDNAFFAGGVFEEVLTKLSKVPQLRVISRTSMERIAKQNLDVAAIGKRLGVSHVLEGSVRRDHDRVRVTVQLIEAGSDNHVWAENYDRKLDDVFAIQSEIALAIAEQLKITLSQQLQSSLGNRPTNNQAAYDLYLRAVEERRAWRGVQSFRAMIALLEPAVAADPDFLAARVRLADSYGRMYWIGEDPDQRYLAKARTLVADIEKRWPDRPESVLARAQLLYTVERNYAAALDKFRAAQAGLPNDMAVLSGISSSLKRLQRNAEFLVAARRWQAVDPESPVVASEVLFALYDNGLYKEALGFADEAARKFPDDESVTYTVATTKLSVLGEVQPMLDYGSRFATATELSAPAKLAIARWVTGDVAGALAVRATVRSDNPLRVAVLDAEQADLLQVLGRGAEARPLAARSLATLRAAIAQGRERTPGGMLAARYAWGAAIAALAGDNSSAAAWEKQALATPVSSLDEQQIYNRALSDLQRYRGDPEAAWLLLCKPIGPRYDLADGQLRAFKSWYDKLYGQSPSYRARMARIAAAKGQP